MEELSLRIKALHLGCCSSPRSTSGDAKCIRALTTRPGQTENKGKIKGIGYSKLQRLRKPTDTR